MNHLIKGLKMNRQERIDNIVKICKKHNIEDDKTGKLINKAYFTKRSDKQIQDDIVEIMKLVGEKESKAEKKKEKKKIEEKPKLTQEQIDAINREARKREIKKKNMLIIASVVVGTVFVFLLFAFMIGDKMNNTPEKIDIKETKQNELKQETQVKTEEIHSNAQYNITYAGPFEQMLEMVSKMIYIIPLIIAGTVALQIFFRMRD